MKTGKKRALWLFNHVTLMESEPYILEELGYEVFIPKIPPFDQSIGINWDFDSKLSIPKKDLEILNQTDFYTQRISRDVMKILNDNFDCVVFGLFIEPFQSLINHFEGILIFHPFGLLDGTTNTKLIVSLIGVWALKRIEELGERFWFGQSYENLSEPECALFKRRSIYLPIGLRDTKVTNEWIGQKKEALFVCPKIKVNPVYENAYKDFKSNFKEIPYKVGGAQAIPVEEDKNVLGFLPKDEFDRLYVDYALLFYQSQHKYHVQYPPFEAIKKGMPVLFMAGGMLDELGGKKLPGRCKTIKEARNKAKRIIKGDKSLIKKIQRTQHILLDQLSYEHCRKIWKESFLEIEKKEINKSICKKYKIAMIVPAAYLGGVLDYTFGLAEALFTGAKEFGEKIEIVFGYLYDENFNQVHIPLSIKDELQVRQFSWKVVSNAQIKEIFKLMEHPEVTFLENNYVIPDDSMECFQDCDFILFMSDRVPGNLVLTKPHGVIVHDYIQRYLKNQIVSPEFEKYILEIVRSAYINFTTTESSRRDCIQHVGINKNKIQLIPTFYKAPLDVEYVDTEKKPFFLWSTNISMHKNHLVMLEALIEYYSMGGNYYCYITGVNTQLFNINKYKDDEKSINQYVKIIREKIESNDLLKKYLKPKGNLVKNQYYSLLKQAKFLVHPGYGDNGNGSCFEAMYYDKPVISSDYPAMRYHNQVLKGKINFFEKSDSEQLAKLLLKYSNQQIIRESSDDNCSVIKEHIVSNRKFCAEIYKIIMPLLP